MSIIVNEKTYENVLFIHIPKTAGISISNTLETTTLNNWRSHVLPTHETYLNIKHKMGDLTDTFIFTSVRNPYTRTYSYYHHFNKINQTNYTFKEFLNFIINAKPFFPKTPFITQTQSFYVVGKNDIIAMNKIYKFENLSEFEKDFNIILSKDNVGKYNLNDYKKDYDDEAIRIVSEYYNEDFINFNYSKNFNIL